MSIDEEQLNLICAKINHAHSTFQNTEYKNKINCARILLEAGFAERMLDNTFVKNIINLLAPFVTNPKIKESIRLLQSGIEEERKKAKRHALGKSSKSRLRSSEINEFHVEVYKNEKDERIEQCFLANENSWKVTDINGYYIFFGTQDKAAVYRETLFNRYKKEGITFTQVNTGMTKEV